MGGETTGQAFDEFSEINMLGGFGGGIKMSAHAKLLFMQKKIKQEIERGSGRANNNETLRSQVDSRGPLACRSCSADPSGIGRRRTRTHSRCYFTDFDPPAFVFYSAVKMPPSPRGKKSTATNLRAAF